MPLTYDTLADLTRTAAGIRARIPLEPLGGPGDKVFPPTYAVPDSARTKYAVESRMSESSGEAVIVESVVLNSVAATGHALKSVLRRAWEDGQLDLPLVGVDFGAVGMPEFGLITDLDSPHGVYDAIQRDSLDGDVPFRHGDIGSAITNATTRNATPLYVNSPIAVLTGAWDSTGPRGGLGSKFERAITGEIVATNIALGAKTSSRIDPLGIQKVADIFETADGGWTDDKSKAIPRAKAMKPSEINHGNVTPSVDERAGGVTAETITATVVLSLIQLRRLQFPTGPDGSALPPDRRKEAATAARATIAALGLAATVLAFNEGFDLRSRCVLAPTSALTFESIGRSGNTHEFELTSDDALALVAEGAARAADAGLPWRAGVHRLVPTERLANLVRLSQEARKASTEGDE